MLLTSATRYGCLLIFGSLLAGCGQRGTIVTSGVATQTLHLGNSAEPATLDPQIYTMMAEWEILSSLFEGLTNLANDGTTILPGVAERWDISPDGLTYTFHLRRNAKWSNGDPFTAEDYVGSVRRLLNPMVATTDPNSIDCVVGARDFFEQKITDFSAVGVRALTSQTVEFRLAYPAPYFLMLVSNNGNPLGMPVHLPSVEKLGGKSRRDGKWTLPGNLVGNGPFRLQAWRSNQAVIVARNEHYWDASRVRLKEVHFHPIEDAAVEERAFRTGQLHGTWGIPASKLAVYQQTRPAEIERAPILHSQLITFNCSRPPFSDPKVRRALALASNRQGAADAGFRNRAQVAHSLVRPGTGGFEPPVDYFHDPAAARKLLADAGFPEGRGFPRTELRLSNGGADSMAVAEALQQMWKQHLGVEIGLTTIETKVMISSYRARDFDLGLVGYFYALDDPSDPLATHCGEGSLNNLSHWNDPRFDAGIKDLKRARNPAERLAVFTRLEQLVATEVPYVPIFHLDRVHLLHPSVKGWRGNRFALVDWRELSLE